MPAPASQDDLAALPQAVVLSAARRHLPLVWIIPLIAGLFGIGLLLQHALNEGPTISLHFADAEGIEPGKTKIRYKNVDIGVVKSVAVEPDRRRVVLSAQLVKGVEDYLVADTRFWVVRPRIAAGSVSGLGTLLSGAYIGVDAGRAEERQRDFVGLEVPPIVTADLPGREFVLHGSDLGSLDVGTPVSFRRIAVGQVVAYQLDPDGNGVTLRIFIHAPYDQYVTDNTRFWHASGIDLALDANGVRLETQSLAALVEGAIAFQTPPDQPAGLPAAAAASFRLHADRDAAMRVLYAEQRSFVVYFKDTLRGLSPGAPVDFHGIVAGEVQGLGVEFDAPAGRFRFPVTIVVYPERLRARYLAGAARPQARSDAASRALVDRLVAAGMRAQLRTGNLLTGQLYVSLDFYPDVGAATVNWRHQPPVLPDTDGGLAQLQDTLAHILKKVDHLPLAQLSGELLSAVRTLNQTLAHTDQLVGQLNADVAPQVRAALDEARRSMAAAQQVLSSDGPLQVDLRAALQQVARSAQAVGGLADFLERHPEALIRGKAADSAPPAAGAAP